MPDDDWQAYVSEVKASLWESPPDILDPYYDKFSPITHDVVPGWSMNEWTLGITGDIRFPTRGCHTVTYQKGRK